MPDLRGRRSATDADDLFARHASHALARYAGNVGCVLDALDRGDLPSAGDVAVADHVRVLQAHLSAKGMIEEDDILLRYGLLVPGQLRGVRPALSALSPSRGGLSLRRLDEASGQIAILREALTFSTLVCGTSGLGTVSALRAIAVQGRRSVVRDDTWIDLHAGLPDEEADALMGRAVHCLDAPIKAVRDLGLAILRNLADFRGHGLGESVRLLFDRGVFEPESVYRGAPDEVARALAASFSDAQGITETDRRLKALVWTRGEVARRALAAWRALPPRWTSELHIPPAGYAHGAGWSLEADGSRRELITPVCHALLRLRGDVDEDEDEAVTCRVPTGTSCPSCHGQLAWLFDFRASPLRVRPQRVLTCESCAFYGVIFSRCYADGTASWHPSTESRCTEAIEPSPIERRRLGPAPRPPSAAEYAFGLDDASSVGGMPMWLVDPHHPACPECGKAMTFFAQLDLGSLPQPEEGIAYAVYCSQCHVAGTFIQQT